MKEIKIEPLVFRMYENQFEPGSENDELINLALTHNPGEKLAIINIADLRNNKTANILPIIGGNLIIRASKNRSGEFIPLNSKSVYINKLEDYKKLVLLGEEFYSIDNQAFITIESKNEYIERYCEHLFGNFETILEVWNKLTASVDFHKFISEMEWK